MIESKHTDSEYTDLYKRYGLDFINSQDLSIPLADIIFDLEEKTTLLQQNVICEWCGDEDGNLVSYHETCLDDLTNGRGI